MPALRSPPAKVFDEYDKDNTGTLAGPELHIFSRFFDLKDASGAPAHPQLAYSQFERKFENWQNQGKIPKSAEAGKFFDEHDLDGNDLLNRAEMNAIKRKLGGPNDEVQSEREAELEAKTPHHDYDMFMQHAGKRAEDIGADPRAVFEELDADASGKLSRKEMDSLKHVFGRVQKSGLSFKEFERAYGDRCVCSSLPGYLPACLPPCPAHPRPGHPGPRIVCGAVRLARW
eukprot:SAG22_NODE_2518_length_2486_cov_2.823209_2_plen_230_part_00